MKKAFKALLTTCGVIILIIIIWQVATRPSNDRIWNKDQQILPYAEFNGDLVTIYNIRNNTYRTTTEYDVAHYDKTFDLSKIKRAWFMVEPFAGYKGAAHTLMSFEFEDNQFVSVSVEIRKEVGESFSAVKGLFRQYELMYVIADEQDVIKLRSNYRKDQVFLYPIKADTEKVRTLFVDMITRTNELKDNPEFYNTLTSTCTTNIVDHVNKITPNKIPLRSEILFPADSDKLAYDLGLLDTTLSFEEARKAFNINERAEQFATSSDFSVRIRE